MELILIRHALPEHVAKEDGSPADPHLSDLGHEQAALMAKWMAEEHIDALYSSPMQRAMQTASPLAEEKQLEPQLREGVAEYDRQASEYIPVEKLKELDYERWQHLMKGDQEDMDFTQFSAEVISTLEEIIAGHRGHRVAVVCHGGVINAWTAKVVGLEPKMFFNPNYTSINRYMAASSGERSVMTLNEHVHLKPLAK